MSLFIEEQISPRGLRFGLMHGWTTERVVWSPVSCRWTCWTYRGRTHARPADGTFPPPAPLGPRAGFLLREKGIGIEQF